MPKGWSVGRLPAADPNQGDGAVGMVANLIKQHRISFQDRLTSTEGNSTTRLRDDSTTTDHTEQRQRKREEF